MNKINAIGDKCPIPVIKAKNALKEIPINEKLMISVDNKIATENLAKMAEEYGYESEVETISDKEYNVTILKTETDNKKVKKDNDKESFVIAIGSDKMGGGEDELGLVLMRNFIYALTEQDSFPETILFYNSGAYLTSEDSKCLDDLKTLEEKGVEIITCGICMDFYGIDEKLAIGTPTNMYSIAEKLINAKKVIKP